MAKAIFFIFVGLFAVTKLADAICCESIKSEVEKKVEANKTLCASGSALSLKCCKDIANEVGKYLSAYETLCLKATLKPCQAPKALGMQSGKIPDNAITASSFYNSAYKTSYGRLNTNKGMCSWTTTRQGRSNSWFQVDLGQLATLTGIATQGSCRASAEWTKTYLVSYSTDAKKWIYYQES
ncbi:Hypothetical predicted protein [Paramuricea clavata]|uniref:Uncharacterized protein n=1 Tax=Paramuricea clavata TaxID=317549 RepID=A0A6S7H3K1_PARCT|nr:Hypothetical predicted protein [Paramuricea clavata]